MEAMGGRCSTGWRSRGDETVIDAGLRVRPRHAALLERLPRGRVIAVDGSPSMIERRASASARTACACRRRPARARPRRAGRRDPLDRDVPLDRRPRAAVRAPARRRCGRAAGSSRSAAGEGNIAAVHAAARGVGAEEPFAPHLAALGRPLAVRRAGGDARSCWSPRASADARAGSRSGRVTPDDPRAYLREINLGAHLEQLPEELREPFVDAVLERLADRRCARSATCA